jgi:hypothetical protein
MYLAERHAELEESHQAKAVAYKIGIKYASKLKRFLKDRSLLLSYFQRIIDLLKSGGNSNRSVVLFLYNTIEFYF